MQISKIKIQNDNPKSKMKNSKSEARNPKQNQNSKSEIRSTKQSPKIKNQNSK